MRRNHCGQFWLGWALGLLFFWGMATTTGAEPLSTGGEANLRPFSDGPLTLDDFQAEPPSEGAEAISGRKAMLFPEIRYDFRYSWKGGGKVTVSATSVTIWSAVDQKKSWFKAKETANAELLDHEQGHFDVAQCHALRLQTECDRLLAGQKLSVVAASEEEGKAALRERLQKLVKQVAAESHQENEEYDRLSVHGSEGTQQAELRKIQKLELARLLKKKKK